MNTSPGLLATAISVPDKVVSNQHWRQNHPQLVAEAEQKIWMWKQPSDWKEGSEAFNREMAPFLQDPFRGTLERRILPAEARILDLEADAARKALVAAELTVEDIDLLICTSFLPDEPGVGGAAHLAGALGVRGGAWNLESACSSGTLGVMTACNLVQSGQYQRILVVVSCAYSRVTHDSDPISWGVGDAATAFVVGPVEDGTGYLGGHTLHTANTCGAVAYHLENDQFLNPHFRMRTGPQAAKLLRDTSEPHLKACAAGALDQAGLALDDVDFFVFNTPLAWYAPFCARALGVDRQRTINMYPMYANVGPALMGVNLFHAAHWRQFEPGDTVMLYSVGSVSSCVATVLRIGELGLGPLPAGASQDHHQQLLDRWQTELSASEAA